MQLFDALLQIGEPLGSAFVALPGTLEFLAIASPQRFRFAS